MSAAWAAGQPDGGDFRFTVGNPRHTGVVDGLHGQPGEAFGDQDALGEPDVRELQGGDQVTDGGDGVHIGSAQVVDEDKSAVELDTGFGVPETVGDRPAADGHEQQFGGDGLAVLQGDGDPGVGVLDT